MSCSFVLLQKLLSILDCLFDSVGLFVKFMLSQFIDELFKLFSGWSHYGIY